ncbi:unnamed protein product [Cylicocyclus nassatus]|uniref:Uncharacterized protein n=1 Tax=Cylicocyclus nassatus TaxID=53992 RepID=A0AA36M7Y8_CYLNA|nr:unnamed protein product [Cylicocyclus nassatus]
MTVSPFSSKSHSLNCNGTGSNEKLMSRGLKSAVYAPETIQLQSYKMKKKTFPTMTKIPEEETETEGKTEMARIPEPKPRQSIRELKGKSKLPRQFPTIGMSSGDASKKGKDEVIRDCKCTKTQQPRKLVETAIKATVTKPQCERGSYRGPKPEIPPKPRFCTKALPETTEKKSIIFPPKQKLPVKKAGLPPPGTSTGQHLSAFSPPKRSLPSIRISSPPEPIVEPPTPEEPAIRVYRPSPGSPRPPSEVSSLSDFSDEEPELVTLAAMQPSLEVKPLGDLFPTKCAEVKRPITLKRVSLPPPEPLTEAPVPYQSSGKEPPKSCGKPSPKPKVPEKWKEKRIVTSASATTILLLPPPEPAVPAPSGKPTDVQVIPAEPTAPKKKRSRHSAHCIYNKRGGRNYWAAKLRKSARKSPIVVVHVCYCSPTSLNRCCGCNK